MTSAPAPIFSLAGKRVWVAGHRGMVGSALVRQLQKENCTVLTVGRHELDLRDGTWNAVHPCVADTYEIETVVRDAHTIEERWRVVGPAKDYTAVTALTRVG